MTGENRIVVSFKSRVDILATGTGSATGSGGAASESGSSSGAIALTGFNCFGFFAAALAAIPFVCAVYRKYPNRFDSLIQRGSTTVSRNNNSG